MLMPWKPKEGRSIFRKWSNTDLKYHCDEYIARHLNFYALCAYWITRDMITVMTAKGFEDSKLKIKDDAVWKLCR